MNIKLDNREPQLHKCLNFLIQTNPKFANITIQVETLPLGDIIISDATSDKLIIERKSLSDLASSIRDGRYEEQSYRLSGLDHPNHNIIYLIEGDLTKAQRFSNISDKLTIYSAIFSLNYYKGFSVIRTVSMEESALFICNSAVKLAKCVDKQPYYTIHQSSQEPSSEPYVNVIKKTKKDNITPENICEIMLCQIPGISATTATAIMAKYPSIKQLIAALESDPECLGDVNYTNAKGQTRKINKNCAEIITNFLLA
jgi:crossover junction endonuclease MUS81